jgi:hypothetical protein
MASSTVSNVRLIDPRGHRFGAALSVVLLAIAFVLNAPILVLAVTLMLGASAAFGTQYSLLGRPWPAARRALRLGPPRELESEYPPRFAQALGFVFLALADVLFIAGAVPLAWLPVAAVAGLQTLLAVTGYCVGCKLYVLRWYVPSLFDRIVGKPRPTFGETFR